MGTRMNKRNTYDVSDSKTNELILKGALAIEIEEKLGVNRNDVSSYAYTGATYRTKYIFVAQGKVSKKIKNQKPTKIVTKASCKECIYLKKFTHGEQYCDYLNAEGHMRPCKQSECRECGIYKVKKRGGLNG